jgi:hypothetical protein
MLLGPYGESFRKEDSIGMTVVLKCWNSSVVVVS